MIQRKVQDLLEFSIESGNAISSSKVAVSTKLSLVICEYFFVPTRKETNADEGKVRSE